MKLHQFWKLYGALAAIDLIGVIFLPVAWGGLPPRAMEEYWSAATAGMIGALIVNAIHTPMFWFLFVPFTERETRFVIASWFAIIVRTIGIVAILSAGSSGFEDTLAICKGVSWIMFLVAIIGFIVWACGERKMSKAPATVAPQLDA
jgi:hypothetical protein